MLMLKHYSDLQKEMGAQRVTGVSKGAGGYRPTVNWREITVKRRNTADKQVLVCITLSGVLIVVVGVVCTVLGFLVIASQCPFMWMETPGACYYLARHNASWSSGREYCHSQSASLLDLHSDEESDFIQDVMLGRSWLGLRRKKDRDDWRWLTGAKVNYTKWQNPNSVPTDTSLSYCAMMEESGDWLAVPCHGEDSAYVICDYTPGYNPFMLVGPVVTVCGLVVLVLSIEVCVRRREFIEKNMEVISDTEDDREVDAGLDNYGYACKEDEDPDGATRCPRVDHPVKSATSTNSWVQQSPTPGASKDITGPLVHVVPGSSKETSSPVVDDAPEGSEDTNSPEAQGSPGGSEGTISPVISLASESRGVSGLMVQVAPASASPSLPPPLTEERSRSQEHLELLLSPKTLE
nr:uncharacterized protein LOC123769950 isoform X1 [Procambarus clarkii]